MAKEQPEMKRISEEEITKLPKGCWTGEPFWYDVADAQLAADKSHCDECKARQEGEITKLKIKSEARHKIIQLQLKANTSLKSQNEILKENIEFYKEQIR